MPARFRNSLPALLLAMQVLVLGSCQTRQSLLMTMGWKEVPAQQKSRASARHTACSASEFSQERTEAGKQTLRPQPVVPAPATQAVREPGMPLQVRLQAQTAGVQWPPLYLLYGQWKDEIAC